MILIRNQQGRLVEEPLCDLNTVIPFAIRAAR